LPPKNELGRYVGLREVEIDPSTNKMEPKSRTICISELLYRRFVAFSKRHYNVESYEVILNDLLNSYEKNNKSDYIHTRRI
jgi:hypothetical protein